MVTTTKTTTATAYLCCKGASDAIAFYTKAFGATELYRLDNGDGTLGHAEIKIGETTIMLSDEAPDLGVLSPTTLGGSGFAMVLDVADSDAAFQRAIDAGATVDRPLRDAPYGRGGWLKDPFGHRWSVMTSNPNFNPDDMK